MATQKSELAALKELNEVRKLLLEKEKDPSIQEQIREWIKATEAKIRLMKHGRDDTKS